MKTSARGTDAFAQRFALATFPDGGVLLNVATGTYFRMNATASWICDELLQGKSREQVAHDLVGRHGVASAEAVTAVANVVAEIESELPRKPIPGLLQYRATESGWAYWDDQRPVIEVSADGRTLRLCDPAGVLPMPLEACVRAIMPKILVLLGVPVLHVGCCAIGGKLVGFGGTSGAGKTTTVRAFAACGARLVSEDTLAIAFDRPGLPVFVESEQRARLWAAGAARALALSPASPIDCAALASVAAGPVEPLARMMFLDRDRRGGTGIRIEHLPPVDALAHFLDANFLASSGASDWRRYFVEAETLARNIESYRARVPDGLDALAEAARTYSNQTASSTS